MLNLENSVTARGIKIPKKYNLRMRPDYIKILQEGGVDTVRFCPVSSRLAEMNFSLVL